MTDSENEPMTDAAFQQALHPSTATVEVAEGIEDAQAVQARTLFGGSTPPPTPQVIRIRPPDRDGVDDIKRDQWAEQTRADCELAGGGGFHANVERARAALHRYGNAGLRRELDRTGLGNNVEVVRAFARMGRHLKPKAGGPQLKE